MRYAEAAEEMVRLLPELRPCYERLVRDWDNFDGEPPGQYNVFSQLYVVWVEVLAALPPEVRGRNEALARGLDVGEELLVSDDGEAVSLGIDSLAETLDAHLEGRQIVDEMGGPALKAWFALYSQSTGPTGPGKDDIIDLWGVREQLLTLLPDLSLPQLPGISAPAEHHELPTLAAAKELPDGAVLLCSYGTSHLFVVARGALVCCDEETLQRTAVDLAPLYRERGHADAPGGDPRPRYFAIPRGERVWNMSVGEVRHSRLDSDLWMADSLRESDADIRAVLDGTRDRV